MADKTKRQEIEELKAEVAALRSTVETLSTLMQVHTAASHILPTAPQSPWSPQPWVSGPNTAKPIWISSPQTVCCTPAGYPKTVMTNGLDGS